MYSSESMRRSWSSVRMNTMFGGFRPASGCWSSAASARQAQSGSRRHRSHMTRFIICMLQRPANCCLGNRECGRVKKNTGEMMQMGNQIINPNPDISISYLMARLCHTSAERIMEVFLKYERAPAAHKIGITRCLLMFKSSNLLQILLLHD